MSANILWQLQLSTINDKKKFVLSSDSNWHVFVLKVQQLVKLDPNIHVSVLLPISDDNCRSMMAEDENVLLQQAGIFNNVECCYVNISPNAVATRYEFDWNEVDFALKELKQHITHVYINDPMLLRSYKAFFHLNGCKPKFIVQTHFLDCPLSKVVDDEVSYWHGTVEAVLKSDFALWHCQSQEDVFFQAMALDYNDYLVSKVRAKSLVWKSGYSMNEVVCDVPATSLRWDPALLKDKVVVWVPNRVGGMGRTLDYTNNGKFLFESVPELFKRRSDFVVVAGNPNQRIKNDEIASACPAYVKLVDDALTRDEYRWLCKRADIVVGLYTNDTNGGLASLEAIENKAIPLFPDIYEYKKYFDAVDWPKDLRVKPDLSDIVDVLDLLMDSMKYIRRSGKQHKLREFIRSYAAYENTTESIARVLGFIS